MDALEKKWKDGELKLFPHQHDGVRQMEGWLLAGHGGVMADEMGLGKTCQTVVLLTRLFFKQQGPFLVVAPLSVCDHWSIEVTRFSHGELNPLKFTGYEADRQKILREAKVTERTVFITAPHILTKDDTQHFFQKQKHSFSAIVIDEAQCVKNQSTQLAACVRGIADSSNPTPNFILLTGTPIQNDLTELYSLLSFANKGAFPQSDVDIFVKTYKNLSNLEALKEILKKYMLRRTKGEVFSKELEKCEQVVLYHGVSQIQKDLYKNIISKNTDAFLDKNAVKLTNILMQLRKCVIHPYMFQGVEPEPFEEGEHLVEASGKLQVLDKLLKYMTRHGHRCLIFSQFLGSLDIVEDFLRMRKWKYERLDGTCRAEERTDKISSFQNSNHDNGPVCFLLSTKAGGVGLNLTAADTVVFLDSDWNPQNDIQAMARCHRIGQTKVVRVIRLVARFTVDQYVVAKARDKLKLTDDIMGTKDSQLQAADIVDMLRHNFGLLMEAETKTFSCTDSELENLIGKTRNGHWMPIEKTDNVVFLNPDECDETDVDKMDYCNYEGVSYRGKTEEWDKLLESKSNEDKENVKRKREYRRVPGETASPLPKRKKITKEEMWAKKGYTSLNLLFPEDEDEEAGDEEEDNPLKYVFGDVTKPDKHSRGKDIILHSVDNGGVFGTGGVFNAIRELDPSIEKSYETAGKMRDLRLGDAHLCTVNLAAEQSSPSSSRRLTVALLVAQGSTNRRNMKPENLENCLRRVSHFAKENGCTIHTPRLGKGCDISWYMVDRLLKKHFSLKGIRCFVYYHPPRPPTPDPADEEEEEAQTPVGGTDEYPHIEREEKKPQERQVEEAPSPSKGRRTRRRTQQPTLPTTKGSGDGEEKDGSDSDMSSCESSGSENNWSGEESEESDGEEEGDGEEESEEDQEVEESPVKKPPKKTIVAKKPKEETEKTVEVAKEPRKWEPKPMKPLVKDGMDFSLILKFSDGEEEDGNCLFDGQIQPVYYRTEHYWALPVFRAEVVSIYKMDDEEEAEEIRKLVEEFRGTVVSSEEDLDQATLVIVPASLVHSAEEELETFKSLFSKDCHFIRQEFISHATGTESLDDLPFFVV